MPRVYYDSFNFKEPSPLTEIEYIEIKAELLSNNSYIFEYSTGFKRQNRTNLIMLIIGFLSIIISITAEKHNIEWLMMLGMLITLFSVGFIFSLTFSSMSYIVFLINRYMYFSKLKKSILNSSDYNEFKKMMEK